MDIVDSARYLYKRIEQREKDIVEILASGGVQDIGHYRSLVGEIQGLSFAREEIRSLLEKNVDDVQDIIGT